MLTPSALCLQTLFAHLVDLNLLDNVVIFKPKKRQLLLI